MSPMRAERLWCSCGLRAVLTQHACRTMPGRSWECLAPEPDPGELERRLAEKLVKVVHRDAALPEGWTVPKPDDVGGDR